MPDVRREDVGLVASKGKPPHRNWVPLLWKILTPAERDHLRSLLRLSPNRTPSARPGAKARALEGRSELGRIMKMPPGRIGQLKEKLIERVAPETGE